MAGPSAKRGVGGLSTLEELGYGYKTLLGGALSHF